MPIALQVLAGKVRYFCYTVSFTVIHMWLTFVQVYKKKKETELLLVLIYFSTVLFSFLPHFLGDAFVCCCLL